MKKCANITGQKAMKKQKRSRCVVVALAHPPTATNYQNENPKMSLKEFSNPISLEDGNYL